jgi:ABC-2 type transport system ATP-binding protein
MNTATNSPQPALDTGGTPLVQARGLGFRYRSISGGGKQALDDLSFSIGPGRVVGLLGHNGAGKTTLLKAMVGLLRPSSGSLSVLGRDPARERLSLLSEACYIPDVATLPRWARVGELITLLGGTHPRFSAERARELLRRTSVGERDRIKTLSKGMLAQAHLALIAAIDARLMILDEPTLGLDVLSRKSFYEMLIEQWCDGERTLIVSTHQVEEIETLLSDVLMLNEGRLVLATSLDEIDRRYVGLAHEPQVADAVAAAHPLLRYRTPRGAAAVFEGEPPASVLALGQRVRPSLVDLFLALTRRPELDRTQF